MRPSFTGDQHLVELLVRFVTRKESIANNSWSEKAKNDQVYQIDFSGSSSVIVRCLSGVEFALTVGSRSLGMLSYFG